MIRIAQPTLRTQRVVRRLRGRIAYHHYSADSSLATACLSVLRGGGAGRGRGPGGTRGGTRGRPLPARGGRNACYGSAVTGSPRASGGAAQPVPSRSVPRLWDPCAGR